MFTVSSHNRLSLKPLFCISRWTYRNPAFVGLPCATEGSSLSATSFSVQSRTESHFNPLRWRIADAYDSAACTAAGFCIRVLLIPRLCNRRSLCNWSFPTSCYVFAPCVLTHYRRCRPYGGVSFSRSHCQFSAGIFIFSSKRSIVPPR